MSESKCIEKLVIRRADNTGKFFSRKVSWSTSPEWGAQLLQRPPRLPLDKARDFSIRFVVTPDLLNVHSSRVARGKFGHYLQLCATDCSDATLYLIYFLRQWKRFLLIVICDLN